MKPQLLKVSASPSCSFSVRQDRVPFVNNRWHYHPEIELLFIKRSSGTWLIGDHIGHFQSGDLVVLGAHLPHCFRHEHKYIIEKNDAAGETICVKFLTGIFGNDFLNLPEATEIKKLLLQCNNGLK